MRRRLLRGLGVLVLTAGPGLIAWHQRNLDPDAWRELARNSPGPELARLASDGTSREADQRWDDYLRALQNGDDEALRVAARLCPLMVKQVHPSEEFLGALGWNLEHRPAEVFELVKPSFGTRSVCMDFDHHSELERLKASIVRRRTAVTSLLDGGLSEAAADCLDELRRL